MKNTGIVIASLVGGMILGSALTMLLTPQSGPELRRQIKGYLDEAAKAQAEASELKREVFRLQQKLENKSK